MLDLLHRTRCTKIYLGEKCIMVGDNHGPFAINLQPEYMEQYLTSKKFIFVYQTGNDHG